MGVDRLVRSILDMGMVSNPSPDLDVFSKWKLSASPMMLLLQDPNKSWKSRWISLDPV